MKSQCPEYFIRTEWVIMLRVTPTASYRPLLLGAPEMQQLHGMYTIRTAAFAASRQTAKLRSVMGRASEHH